MGFIIISPDMRGKGIGKQMLSQALKYAFEIFGVQTVTLGVFANNESALGCYKAAGFVPVDTEKECFEFGGEKWDCINMKAERS
jgi:RimJ/RimL family protein N-acetyltransferase